MIDISNPNVWIFAGVLVFALLLVWYLFGRAGTPRARSHKPDVLDEGVAPAQRNQALIDAAPAAQIVPPVVREREREPEPVVLAKPEVVAPPPPAPAPLVAAEPARAAPPPPVEVPAPEPEPVEIPAPEIEPEPLPEPEPAPEPEPVPPPPPPPAPVAPVADDLGRIKGLGPKLQTLLPQLGISTFTQIAALTEADLADLDGKLGPFAGRPAKDNWVEQAQFLAAGDVAGFEALFGKV
jgi:predicted flap endonuclease-1-like 5' DNA nuclease